MSAPKAKAVRYKETYETRMINELAARLIELEEHFRDHLLECEGTREALAERTPANLAFVKARCPECAEGIPHAATNICDSTYRDQAKRGPQTFFDAEAHIRRR